MHRNFRILILLLVLLAVASVTLYGRLRVRDWARPLQVSIYPVAMDPASGAYVGALKAQNFREIGEFLRSEASRWKKPNVPEPQFSVRAQVAQLPPLGRPQSALESVLYTLKLRWYVFRNTPFRENFGTIRIFVLYHPLIFDQALPHSLGLQKGLLGIVHAFADVSQQRQNNIVIAHELLHTLGATDKYGGDGEPLFPAGFVQFAGGPSYPQAHAEIMAGRRPLAPGRSEMPRSLDEVRVGFATAAEIGW